MIYNILEICMLILFGLSWPFSLAKSIKEKSTKGKSPIFLSFVILGYIAGIFAKLLNPNYMASFSTNWYVLCFYILNTCMVTADLIMFFINKHREHSH